MGLATLAADAIRLQITQQSPALSDQERAAHLNSTCLKK